MTFLNPILVSTGMACIAIPILIHILMRRRRKPIAWGAMKFLLEAYRRQRRRINLEQILLLASRCLLVALLALALGKPILGATGANAGRPRTVYLLVDNSLTSGVEKGAATALDASKDTALAILRRLDATRGDRAGLITVAGPPERGVLPASSDLAGVAEAVRQIVRADSRADFAGALAMVRDAVRASDSETPDLQEITIVLLSEFRAGSADLSSALPVVSGQGTRMFALSPAQEPADNVAVTSVSPLRSMIVSSSPGAAPATPVRVTLARFGPAVGSGAVSKVLIEVRPAGAGSAAPPARSEVVVTWRPGQETASAAATISMPAPDRPGAVLIAEASIDRDSLAADNTVRRPVVTRRRLEAGVIGPSEQPGTGGLTSFTPADWWALALSPRPDTPLSRASSDVGVLRIDPSRLIGPAGEASITSIDVLVVPRPDLLDAGVWSLLRRAVDAGALLIVSPPPGVQTHAWTDDFARALALDWTFERTGAAPQTPRGISLAPAAREGDLLGMIAPELDDLLRPVRVTAYLPVRSPGAAFEPVLMLDSGEPWVVAGAPGAPDGQPAPRGTVLYVASPMDLAWTDLPTKPLMVPLVQELVRQGVGRSSGALAFAAGTPASLPVGTRELTRAGEDGDAPPRPLAVAPGTATPIRRAGVLTARGDGDATLAILAVNPDPAGSDTATQAPDAVLRWLAPLGEAGLIDASGNAGPGAGAPENAAGILAPPPADAPPVSVPLLAAALAVALVELTLARFFSHAHADAGAPGVPA